MKKQEFVEEIKRLTEQLHKDTGFAVTKVFISHLVTENGFPPFDKHTDIIDIKVETHP